VNDIASNIRAVRERITASASHAGRAPEEITLVVVTKGIDIARIAEAVEAGERDLGENKVQEWNQKQAAIAAVRWHLIGSLQRNKANDVASNVALIHSVDSVRLAEAIAKRSKDVQDILLQVNTSGETSKHGVSPRDASVTAERIAAVTGVRLRGLMTMAAPGGGGRARQTFRALRALRDALCERMPAVRELSMGMSDDFEEAIEEGATIVRVGSAIFAPGGR